MRIALAQIAAAAEPELNLKAAARLCPVAAARGARLIAFPEMFMAVPAPGSAPISLAQPLNGPFVAALEGIARENEIALVAGLWERLGTGAEIANTLAYIDPCQGLRAWYRKIHLFDAFQLRESDTVRAGDAPPPILQVNDLRLGLATCYDLRFPELFRDLALRGAEAILVAAAWYSGPFKEDHWLTLLKARAIENTCYLVGVDQCGPKFCGRSAGFDPFGVLLTSAGEAPVLLDFELDRHRLLEVRRKLPVLDHHRPDLYPLSRRPSL